MIDFKKLYLAMCASPLILQYLPYSEKIHAIKWLIVGDIITGILADVYEKKNSLHPFYILKEFRSKKLVFYYDDKGRLQFGKLVLVTLFSMGLFFIHKANPLMVQFNLPEYEMGQWYCIAYGLYELFSLLENLGRLNFPIAKQIKALINNKLPTELKQEDKDGSVK